MDAHVNFGTHRSPHYHYVSMGRILEGQRALVTGANSGIGAGIVRALAQAGAEVAVNYVAAPERTEALIQEIRRAGGIAIGVRADVSDEKQVQDMFEQVRDEFGDLDILVNNAGLQRDAKVHEMSLDDWNHVIGVNLTGQFLCSREAVRTFLRRKVDRGCTCSAGKIICISSVHDRIPWAGHANYAASKGGVMLLMQTMAQELAAHKIRVNSISPGAIKTPINRSAWESPEAEAGLLELLRFGLQPAVRLMRSDYPVLRIWQLNLEEWQGDQTVNLYEGGVTLLIQRRADTVTVAPLAAGDYWLLEQLNRGERLADAIAAAVSADPGFDPGAALARFLRQGLLVDFFTDAVGETPASFHSHPEV